MLLQPRHQLDQVAGPEAAVELPFENIVPAVAAGAGRSGRGHAGAAGRDHHVDRAVGDPGLELAHRGRRSVRQHEAAVVEEPQHVGRDADDHGYVVEVGAAGGAVLVDLEKRRAVLDRRAQEIVDVVDGGIERGEQVGEIDEVAAGQPVEIDDQIESVETARVEDEAVAAGAARQGVGAGAGPQQVGAVAAEQLIVAFESRQGVVAEQPAQHVVAVIAVDGVGQAIARAVDVAGADLQQVLQVGAQGVGQAGGHPVRSAVRAGFRDLVADVVEVVGVVAVAAGHAVGAAAARQLVGAVVPGQRVVAVVARQEVVAGVAGDLVAEVVAVAGDAGDAGQRQVLDVVAEFVAGAAVHLVRALAGIFDDQVVGRVDLIGVVAGAADRACRCRCRRRACWLRHCRPACSRRRRRWR